VEDKTKVAFVGFGEVNTPKDIIINKCKNARKLLEGIKIDIIAHPIVSDDEDGEDVKKALSELSGKEFDLLIICIAGWIPSHAVISITSKYSHKPMLLWGLTGYYENGILLTTADQAGTSALRKVFEDMGYKFKYIYNSPDVEPRMDKISDFVVSCKTASVLNGLKVGMMGYRDMNLYGTLYDGSSLRSKIGIEIENFEMLEMVQKAAGIKEEAVDELLIEIKNKWEFMDDVNDDFLKTGIKYYLALKNKIEKRKYAAFSLIDVDGMKKLLLFPPSMILTLISDDMGIPTIPENDTLGSVTQIITKNLTGQIAAYMEFYEFMEDRLLIGVPDYVPSEIVEGNVKVMPTNFGNISGGLLNVSSVKTGKVTLCRLFNRGQKYLMHMVTAQGIPPRKWEEVGWQKPAPQLPSLEVLLDSPIEDFTQNVMSQHYILSYGDNTQKYIDLCNLLDIEVM
jgi:L-fucose isomerase-like protein